MSTVRDHQLDKLLHTGTTSEVWSATRLGPNGFAVPVALKTLTEEAATKSDLVRSFLKESRAASSVQHPNVVGVRELIFDRNRYWMSMDLVIGCPVRALLATLDASRQRIPIPMALSLVRDAARGLQAIHDADIVHRNIAPDNLLINGAGQLVVLDFGLATWQHSQRIRFTPPIEALDPVYASPDLRARLPVDARTDVFSLGVLLDQLIPDREDVPVALDAIIKRALDGDAERRFQTAQALEIALDLVSIRENWLVPQSYVAAYLNDVFRVATAVMPETVEAAPADERPASVNRAVLPRGRHGMVGVGALLPSPQVSNDPPPVPADRAGAPFYPRAQTALPTTRVRVRR